MPCKRNWCRTVCVFQFSHRNPFHHVAGTCRQMFCFLDYQQASAWLSPVAFAVLLRIGLGFGFTRLVAIFAASLHSDKYDIGPERLMKNFASPWTSQLPVNDFSPFARFTHQFKIHRCFHVFVFSAVPCDIAHNAPNRWQWCMWSCRV